MKRSVQVIAMLLLVTSICAQTRSYTINPIIGDESFVALFGVLPDENTNEQLRIQAHLFYVETKLRAQSRDGLSEQQKKNREMVLDLLHDYWTNGVFPANFDYPDERKPCFIDRNGTICAVGYLVEKTAGLEVAQQINEKHQYDYLLDMKEPELAAWAEEHGFTLEECAMIQPTYGGWPDPITTDPSTTINKPISTGYGISSGLVGGFNLAVNTINLSGRFGKGNTISYLGLVSGASQVIMGLSNIKKDRTIYNLNDAEQTVSYKAQNHLSYLNVAMGTATMITSAVNIYINNKLKSKNSALNLYSYPGLNNEMNLGLTFARRL